MIPMRLVHSMVAALAILGIACSSTSSPPSGNGGSHGTGGVSGQGGTTASGGTSGTGGADGTGGAPSQGGTMGSGGATQPGTGGVNGTGGRTSAGSGGVGTGGRLGSGGAGVGGASTATGGTVPAASGGNGALGGASGSGSGGASGSGSGGASSPGSGGATGPGSGGSSGGSGADAGVAQSAGCGKTRTLQNGTITIQSNGSRKYILLVPSGYDSSHAYRLVFAFAESGSSAQSVADRNYFRMATLDTSKNTIFAAPDAANGAGSWSNSDLAFTDAILAQLEGDLCIDTTRVFATGFSFGAGMAMALACTRADVFRAVAFFSGADLTGSCPTTLTKPIAYYASQASQDANGLSITDPMTGEMKQAQFAAVNGCTAEPASTNYPAAGQPHTCTNYKGCSAGHPTEYCVFNGPHGWEPVDPGQTTSWDPPEAWKFITQF